MSLKLVRRHYLPKQDLRLHHQYCHVLAQKLASNIRSQRQPCHLLAPKIVRPVSQQRVKTPLDPLNKLRKTVSTFKKYSFPDTLTLQTAPKYPSGCNFDLGVLASQTTQIIRRELGSKEQRRQQSKRERSERRVVLSKNRQRNYQKQRIEKLLEKCLKQKQNSQKIPSLLELKQQYLIAKNDFVFRKTTKKQVLQLAQRIATLQSVEPPLKVLELQLPGVQREREIFPSTVAPFTLFENVILSDKKLEPSNLQNKVLQRLLEIICQRCPEQVFKLFDSLFITPSNSYKLHLFNRWHWETYILTPNPNYCLNFSQIWTKVLEQAIQINFKTTNLQQITRILLGCPIKRISIRLKEIQERRQTIREVSRALTLDFLVILYSSEGLPLWLADTKEVLVQSTREVAEYFLVKSKQKEEWWSVTQMQERCVQGLIVMQKTGYRHFSKRFSPSKLYQHFFIQADQDSVIFLQFFGNSRYNNRLLIYHSYTQDFMHRVGEWIFRTRQGLQLNARKGIYKIIVQRCTTPLQLLVYCNKQVKYTQIEDSKQLQTGFKGGIYWGGIQASKKDKTTVDYFWSE